MGGEKGEEKKAGPSVESNPGASDQAAKTLPKLTTCI